MPERVALDSGPLVALFDGGDAHHAQAVAFSRRLKAEPVTTLAVVTEVLYLLDFSVRAQAQFLEWICDGGLTLIELKTPDLKRAAELMRKYADFPMDFADASLVAICERLGVKAVASVDRHFSVYRSKGRLTFRNVFPAGM